MLKSAGELREPMTMDTLYGEEPSLCALTTTLICHAFAAKALCQPPRTHAHKRMAR